MKQWDVLVAGGGAAAVRAACAAFDTGASVAMITGNAFASTGSTYYPFSPAWGIMYADSDRDKEAFRQEISASAMGCMKPELMQLLIDRSAARYADLRSWGLSFIPLADIQLQTCFGGSLRGAVLDDVRNLKTAFSAQLQRRGIPVYSGLHAIDLLMQERCCRGLVCADEKGALVSLPAKAVILAMGGAESLWQYRCAGNGLLGGAYAMAARHGAAVVNLEFIQFLLGTLEPVPQTLFYHFTLDTDPIVTDAEGGPLLTGLPEKTTQEDCLRAHAQHGPFTTVDASMYIERSLSARSREKGCACPMRLRYTKDLRKIPAFSRWVLYLDRMGIDFNTQEFVLFPHCQGFNGGVEIDMQAQTAIPGLYACGESAGGIHGANRMGGNSILATQVFGEIAGTHAAAYARNISMKAESLQAVFSSEGRDVLTAREALEQLRSIMQRYAFIERNAAELRKAGKALLQLQDSFHAASQAQTSQSPLPYMVANALLAAQLIVQAMLQRNETRGGHLRTDATSTAKEGLIRPVLAKDLAKVFE